MEAQDPQVWIRGDNPHIQHVSQQAEKQSQPRTPRKREAVFDPELNPLAQRIGAGQTKQCPLSSQAPACHLLAPRGQQDGIMAGLGHTHRCFHVESRRPFVGSLPSSQLLTTSTEHCRQQTAPTPVIDNPQGGVRSPAPCLCLPGTGDHPLLGRVLPNSCPSRKKAGLCKPARLQSRRRWERVHARPIIRTQLAAETV